MQFENNHFESVNICFICLLLKEHIYKAIEPILTDCKSIYRTISSQENKNKGFEKDIVDI